MYKQLLPIILVTAVFPSLALAAPDGRIVLQVEEHGEAWYINPADHHRYYLGRPDDAFAIMKELGLGITNADFKRLSSDAGMRQAVRGKIVLQVEKHGEAWYINPVNDQPYYLGKPARAWKLMTKFGLGISNADLATIPIGIPGETLPDSVLLSVPFTTQAPYGYWGSPYNEACEEAILVMLKHYYANTSLSADTANTEILDIVNWEQATYGYHEDTAAAVTAQTAQDYLGLSSDVSSDVSTSSIKRAVSKGHPVIVPVYGKALNNPHYKNGGPYYHMILIVGYNTTSFITHDPGTRYGEHYSYEQTNLMNAIHDLTDPESNVATGSPAMVIMRD
ncbi:MAG: hypothetical protein ACD_41C00368G0007 [uncultured bacterium]|nr:MAG: hypothetical protein ACD_41C00368G0007 [uncultured bacterium]